MNRAKPHGSEAANYRSYVNYITHIARTLRRRCREFCAILQKRMLHICNYIISHT